MIQLLEKKITQELLQSLCLEYFKTFVKFVVDIHRSKIAIGGELHADAESMLLESGSDQKDLWGGNFYPWHALGERIEYTSFINIRPKDGNKSMEILSPDIREKVLNIVEQFVLLPSETLENEPE